MKHQAIFLVLAAATTLVACNGRTLDDVRPTGDTVDVVIKTDSTVIERTVRELPETLSTMSDSTAQLPDTVTTGAQSSASLSGEQIHSLLNAMQQQ